MSSIQHPDKIHMSSAFVHLSGVIYTIVGIWAFEWIITHLNTSSTLELINSILFLLAATAITINGFLLVINNWNFLMLRPRAMPSGAKKPKVAVLIPTYGEPLDFVINTLESVVGQNWPKENRVIIVSDDAHNTDLEKAIASFSAINNEPNIIYHRPHKKGHLLRKGEAKAGNLNSALELVRSEFPDIKYIETRDADDLVGTKNFLSNCLELMERDTDVSFVQTIKRCATEPGDPFSNQEHMFYERIMPVRAASNALFPCGSGLIWRLESLLKIGGFPAWNLVEDLQSGFEILKQGGKGAYLPIIGAIGQIAPHDIPNFYKQRGTWALDTLRLFFWKNPLFSKGLNIRQKLQFFELEYSYLLSFATAIFIFNLILALSFKIYPIASSPAEYLMHFGIFAIAFELFLFARARGLSYAKVWRSRQIWLGLMPIFIKATFAALRHGPSKKPAYRVTRKHHQISWYWKETLIQKLVVVSLSASIAISIFFRAEDLLINIISIFWASLFIFGFSQVVKNSWHGIELGKSLRDNVAPIGITAAIILLTILGGMQFSGTIKPKAETNTPIISLAFEENNTDFIEHIVKEGETLRMISLQYFGVETEWKRIIIKREPDLIYPGDIALIPKVTTTKITKNLQ